MAAHGELDCDIAAQLLSSICPDSIKRKTEIELGSPQSFAYLLFRSKKLCVQVKQAMHTGKFEDVWKTCLLVAQPEQLESDGYLPRGHEIPNLLGEISESLEGLVNGKFQLPLWSLERSTVPGVATIDLDSYAQRGFPPMLFHNLGSFQQNIILNKRVQNIFVRNQNTFLLNASATGKTRLLFEGLCQNWGFYFTARPNIAEASTLQSTLVESFTSEDEIMLSLPPASALSFDRTLARNREVANRRFSLVLLPHLLVFRDFLKVASESHSGVTDDHRHRWLVAQLWHCCLSEYQDIYASILNALEWESSTFIKNKLAEMLTEICLLLPTSIKEKGLFFVIDEANLALNQLWRSHHNDNETYPAIKEMINVWREQLVALDVPITFIVAGTEIPIQYFPRSSPEWSSWMWTSSTGAFDTPEIHQEYLSFFLPASQLNTPSGQALVRRAWDWCAPRHRFTAAFIEMLLKDKLVHPHGVLNCHIKTLTTYEARDADNFIASEGLCNALSHHEALGFLAGETSRTRFTTHAAIFHYIINGPHPLHFDTSKIELVNAGIGEFIDKDMKVIALEQRMPIIAAAMYLSRDDRVEHKKYSLTSFEDFCSYFQDRWPDGDTYVARNYLAFSLAYIFTKGCVLEEVFNIPAPPAWIEELSESANLVILRKDASGIIRELVLGPSALFPSAPLLGFVASTAEDVIAWLNHERFAAFCCCPPECGAELIFVLKVKQKYLWVVVRTAGRGTQTPDIDLYEEFGQLKLKDLFPDLALSGRVLEAFNTLPNSVGAHGNVSVLRVLASFPSEPELLRNVAQRLKEPPVATLNNATFKSVTESIEGPPIIEALISSMQGRRGEYTDAIFTIPAGRRHGKPPSKTSSVLSLPEDPLEDEKSKATAPNSKDKSVRRGRTEVSSPMPATHPSPANRCSPTSKAKATSPTTPTPSLPISPKPYKRLRQPSIDRGSPSSPTFSKPPSVKRSSAVSPKPYSRSRKGSADGDSASSEHTPPLRRSPKEHRVSESSSVNRSPLGTKATLPPSPTLPVKRSASPRPYPSSRKRSTDLEDPSSNTPIPPRSPRKRQESEPSRSPPTSGTKATLPSPPTPLVNRSSLKPYPSSRKSSTGEDSSSKNTPIVRRSPREHKVSEPSSKG